MDIPFEDDVKLASCPDRNLKYVSTTKHVLKPNSGNRIATQKQQ